MVAVGQSVSCFSLPRVPLPIQSSRGQPQSTFRSSFTPSWKVGSSVHPPARLIGRRVALLGLRMFEVSIDGLNAIMFSCAILALVSPLLLKDNSGFIDWVSAKLLGEDDDDDSPSPQRVQGSQQSENSKAGGDVPRVRNPVTGRWIAYEGKTYKELAKKGIITEGSEEFEYARVGLTWEFKETQAGTGIKPCEGSAAVLHHCTRLYGPDGPILSTSITNMDSEGKVFPFVFEVGDVSVVKGLNEAILSMKEGCKGVLTLPPHMGYSSQRVEPAPSSSEASALLAKAMRDPTNPVVVVMDLHLLRVLAMPPDALLGGGHLSPRELQELLLVGGDEDYSLKEVPERERR